MSPTTAVTPPLLISDDSSPPPPPCTRRPQPRPQSRSLGPPLHPRPPPPRQPPPLPLPRHQVPRSLLHRLPPPRLLRRVLSCRLLRLRRGRRLRRRRRPPRPPLPRRPAASTLPFAASPQHLLRSLARDALPAHALYLYLRLAAAGDPSLRPDNFTYSFAVSAFFAGGGSPLGELRSGYGFELFQKMAGIGAERLKLVLQEAATKDELMGKTAEQIAFDGIASAIIQGQEEGASWNAARSVAVVKAMAAGLTAGRGERIS